MPLPVAHGLLGASIVAAIHPRLTTRRFVVALLCGALFANAADFDFLIAFALHSKSWHRGFTHSVVFALFICILAYLIFGKQHLKVALAYGLAFTSHCALDYLTSYKGAGVELLWPFSTERMKFGRWGLSELPSQLPASGVVKAVAVEFVLFAPLLLVVLILRKRGAVGQRGSQSSVK